jgi:acetyl-CoA synthetase
VVRSTSGGRPGWRAARWGASVRGEKRAFIIPIRPEGFALRINDCQPRLILTQQCAEALSAQFSGATVVEVNDAFWAALQAASPAYTPDTRAADLAVFQYTSGTTRELPEAVKHTHRSVVTLMIAALYGVGLRLGERYFCPSSPA